MNSGIIVSQADLKGKDKIQAVASEVIMKDHLKSLRNVCTLCKISPKGHSECGF